MILVEPDIRVPFSRRLRLKNLEQFLVRALAAVKLRGDVSVLLTGDRQIRRWNREFRGKNKSTDVLSFPAPVLDGHPTPIAGDLAISVETADRQAKEHGHVLAEELKILMLHGLLHLGGYDHETDNGEMARKEQRLRAKLDLHSSLIERSELIPQRQPPARSAKTAGKPVKTARRAETAR